MDKMWVVWVMFSIWMLLGVIAMIKTRRDLK